VASDASSSKPRILSSEQQESSRRFAQLKPLCLEVLASIPSERNRSERTTQDAVANGLQALEEKLGSMIGHGERPLDVSLIAYVFFPMSKMMRQWPDPPDRIRTRQFSVLAHLLQDWWQEWVMAGGQKGSLIKRWGVWDELLLLCAIALSRSQERADYSDETILAILHALQNLLSPRLTTRIPSSAKHSMEEWEWDGVAELPDLDDYEREMGRLALEEADDGRKPALIYPSDAHLEHIYSSKRCRSVLAHALTASIDLCRRADRPRQVRSSSLRIVRTILHSWIAGSAVVLQNGHKLVQSDLPVQRRDGKQWIAKEQANRVSLYLPGVTSAIVRIAITPKETSEVLAEALSLLRILLTTCCNDEAMESLVPSRISTVEKPVTLEELITNGVSELKGTDTMQPADEIDDISEHMTSAEEVSGSDRELVKNITIALEAIHALRLSELHSVQVALAELASELLLRCWLLCNAMGSASLARKIFGWLVYIASSQASSSKAKDTATALAVQVLRAHPSLLREDLSVILQNWPHLLNSSAEEEELADVATRLTLLLRMASGGVDSTFRDRDALEFLFSASNYERWTFMLVTSIRFDGSAAVQTALRLQNISLRVNDAVMRTFKELGSAASRSSMDIATSPAAIGSPLAVIEHLVRLSGRLRSHDVRLSLNAAVLAELMLSGAAEQFDDIGRFDDSKLRKRVKKATRTIISDIVNIWHREEEEVLSDELMRQPSLTEEEKGVVTAHTDAADSVLSEYTRGLMPDRSKVETPVTLGPSLRVDFVNAAKVNTLQHPFKPGQMRSLRDEVWSKGRCDAVLLQAIAHTAKILGQSIRPLMINTIYPMISALASSNDILQDSAASAVQKIAYSAGYASTQGLLLDHADYILGAACHRLVSTLSLELEFQSRMLTVPDGPSYTPMTSAISAPLVLVEMIRSLGSEVVALVEDAIDEVLDAIDRFHTNDEVCDSLLTVLERVVEAMLEQDITQPTASTKDTPAIGFAADNDRDFDAFAAWYGKREGETMQEDNVNVEVPDTTAAEAESSATRTQVVTEAMLKKALPFLSHSNRTIRLRCLRLINHGIEFLCRQGLKVEPLSVVNDCWPILMRRCGFSLERKLPEDIDKAKAEDLDEKDFFVAVEAVKLVATVARHLVEYVGGKKVFEQAVPRIMLLLAIVERAELREADQRQPAPPTTFLLAAENQAVVPDSDTSKPSLRFRPLRPYSPLAILCEQVLLTLDTLVASMGPAITEADLFAFATHSTLLTCLDSRQLVMIRDQARRFYHQTLNDRNAPLVWFTLQAAAATPGFPAYLAHPELSMC
jgi:hypothetical protein